MSSHIAEREMGSMPISIATALAIDGLYNRHPDLKKQSPLPATKAHVLYINVRTLFRNVFGAIGDSDKAMSVKASEYADCILQEMDEIRTQLMQEEHPLEVVYYLPTYKDIAKYMGNGELRPLTTDNQKQKNKLENDTLQAIHDAYKGVEDKPFIDVNVEIWSKTYRNIFIITHLPMDLLNLKNTSEVFLLESHTGRLKPKNMWYTKFAVDKSPKIPFNKGTMLFYGDSGNIFKPQPIKARKRLLEVAEKRKWNAHTSRERMIQGLELEVEPYLIKTIKALFR